MTTPDAATEAATEEATVTAPEGKPETEVQAAFEVEGFSTFTITYRMNRATYSRPVSVLLDGVELTEEQLCDFLNVNSVPDITLQNSNQNSGWVNLSSLLIRYNIHLNGSYGGKYYSFDHAANESGIAITWVRLNTNGEASQGSWLRYGRDNNVPRDDYERIITQENSDKYVFEYPAGETLRLYYYSNDSTPGTIDTADTSGKVQISLFDYKGKDINSTLNGSGEQGGTKFAFDGKSESESVGGQTDQSKQAPHYTHWTERDGGVVQGIVKNTLGSDGYPVLNRSDQQSLDVLFDPDSSQNKAYTNLNKLFIYDEATGYYTFDSSLNFAKIDPNGSDSGQNFTVYNRPNNGTSSGSTGIPYFMPFNNYGVNADDLNANYHFGMSITTNFLMPKDGKINNEDMMFSFTGDDDVWVYIDGVLVLDMGGIHDSNSGRINFGNGTVTVDKVYYKANENGYGGSNWNNASNTLYIGDLLYAAKRSDEAWIDANLEQRNGHWYLKDYTQHDLSFFYLERGAVDSNCKIEFNLYTLQTNTLTVGKDLDTTTDTTPAVNTWLGNLEYTFRVLKQNAAPTTENKNDLFITPNTPFDIYNADNQDTGRDGTVDENGTFTLHAGEYAVFHNISEGAGSYYVQELVNSEYSEQFGNVVVSVDAGGGQTFTDENAPQGFDGVISNSLDASEGAGAVVFTNQVDTENLSLLTITKAAASGSYFGDDAFQVYAEIDGEPVDGTFVSGDNAVAFEDGLATFQVGTTVSIPVLTGAEFTIYEVGSGDYNVTYSATQTFADKQSGEYDLEEGTNDDDDTTTVSGEVGDVENTADVSNVTDATNATMAVTLTNKKTNADLTIVKNIYGLSADEVENWITNTNANDRFRFDVDYFDDSGSLLKNEVDGGNNNKGDWTFDVQDTLDDKGFGQSEPLSWDAEVTGYDDPSEAQSAHSISSDEVDHYKQISMTQETDSDGVLYFKYTVTIEDIDLNDWYRVWELHTDVPGYTLDSSVEEYFTGEDEDRLGNYLTTAGAMVQTDGRGDHGGKASAFQLTGDTTVEFTNVFTHNAVTVNFKKVESGTNTGLAGAKFYLYYTDMVDGVSTTYYYQAPSGDATTATWLQQTSDGQVPAGATQLTSVAGGILSVPGLEVDRTYTLQEVEAPAGYQLPEQNIIITVSEDGLVSAANDNSSPIGFTLAAGATGEAEMDSSTPFDPTKITYLIPNSTGTALPETGGAGTNFLTIGGLLLMAAAVGGGCVLRRRRGKEAG